MPLAKYLNYTSKLSNSWFPGYLNYALLLGSLGNQVFTKECAQPSSGLEINKRTRKVRISVDASHSPMVHFRNLSAL